MVPSQEPDAVFEVRALLRRINESWLKGAPSEVTARLSDCFTDTVVFNGPGFVEVAVGKDDCIAGYAEFAASANIQEAILSEARVNCFGDSAIASYTWRLKYSLEGDHYDESGHDVFLCIRTNGAWKATWRAMLPEMAIPS